MKTQTTVLHAAAAAAGALQETPRPLSAMSQGTSLSSAFIGAQPEPGKLQAKKTIQGRIETIINFVRSRADLLAKLDKELPPVMLQCLYHFEKHGDVSLADMLVKGIWAADQSLGQEVIFWFKKYSPVSWDPQGKAYVRSREDHPMNVAGAEATPYHQEAEVKAKREQSKRTIEPFGPKVAFQRIKGILGLLERAQAEDGRGLAEGVDAADLQNRLKQIVVYAAGLLNQDITKDTAVTEPVKTEAKTEAEPDKLSTAPPVSTLIKRGRRTATVSAAN